MSEHENELYNLATAYYKLGRRCTKMDLAKDRPGNRTSSYGEALTMLQHAKEHIWQDIRSHIIICGIKEPDAIMDSAYKALLKRAPTT